MIQFQQMAAVLYLAAGVGALLGLVLPAPKVQRGARFGLIRFGSRCDVYLTESIVPMVDLGMTCVAGETVIADAATSEPARESVAR